MASKKPTKPAAKKALPKPVAYKQDFYDMPGGRNIIPETIKEVQTPRGPRYQGLTRQQWNREFASSRFRAQEAARKAASKPTAKPKTPKKGK